MSDEEPKSNKSIAGGVIGGLAGIPGSYFIQPGALRQKYSLGDYVAAIFTDTEVFTREDLWGEVFIGVVIGIIIGAIVGRLISK